MGHNINFLNFHGSMTFPKIHLVNTQSNQPNNESDLYLAFDNNDYVESTFSTPILTSIFFNNYVINFFKL